MNHFAELINMDMITAYHRIISADDYKSVSAALSANDYATLDTFPGGVVAVVRAINGAVERKKNSNAGE